jgi:integrase
MSQRHGRVHAELASQSHKIPLEVPRRAERLPASAEDVAPVPLSHVAIKNPAQKTQRPDLSVGPCDIPGNFLGWAHSSNRWFYQNRFPPQKEQQWKVTARPKTKRFIENYLLKSFGVVMLNALDKFTLQTYLNELAPNVSKSVLTKIRVYLNSILDEAVELQFIIKNPVAKLAVPRSGKKVTGVHLTPEQIPVVLFNLSDRDRLIVRMFLVLGLRPGELFALRWNDKAQNSLRIDSSITDGIEVETKTEGSNTNVWLPVSIDTELEWWRSASKDATPDAFVFPSARGAAINTNNFLFRVLKEAGKGAGVAHVTHQMLRSTCSTYMAQLTTVKDVQAHFRHTNVKTTLDHYIKSVPESVRVAVESLDHLLKSKLGPTESEQTN